MKNRNIPYYVAALMLAAGVSTSFVSCVDTDEPETVTKLRQEAIAKLQADADFVKAQAELQRAKAAHENADAKFRDQETLTEAAKTKAAELANKLREDTLSAATAHGIAVANKAAQKAIEDMKSATQTYEVAAADYARALEAAKQESERKAKEYAYDDKGQSIVANYLSEYVDAQKATLEAQVAYNQAVADAVTGAKIHHDAEYDDKGKKVKDAWDEDLKGSVDFENDVKTKEVALANAKANLKDLEDKFAELDVENWQKEYEAAETALVKAKKERAKLQEEKEVKAAEVTKKQAEINNTLETWQKTTATYSFEISESLKKAIFGENSTTRSIWVEEQYWDDLAQEWKKSYFKHGEVEYTGGKMLVKKTYGNIQQQNIADIANQDAEDILNDVLNEILSQYKDPQGANTRKQAWESAKEAFNNSELKKMVEGKGDKSSDDQGSDKYKGYKTDYTAKYTAWQTVKGKSDATDDAKEEAKLAYESIASLFLGGTTNPNGNLLNGYCPSEDEVWETVKNQNGNDISWGEYGKYVKEKKGVSEAENTYNNYTAGNALYGDIEKKIKEVETARTAAEKANAESLAADETLVKLKKELEEATLAYTTKDLEVSKYEAIQKAIDGATTDILGLKDKSGNDVTVEFDKLETAKKNALAALEKEVSKAQAEKDAADAALKAHNEGKSDAQINVTYKKKLWDIAADKEAYKKAEYEAVKKLYVKEENTSK
jgi:hypothetical protein